MGLETATYIDELDPSWPTTGDPVSKGDDHLQLIKQVLQNSFPGISGAVSASDVELSFVDGVTSAIQTQIDAAVAAYSLGITPVGGIIMYNGTFAAIPANWQLCDGTGVTPDLTDKFIYGTNTEIELEDTGGSADAIVVAHIHTTVASGVHTHNAISDHQHAAAGGHTHSSDGSHNHTATQGTHTHSIFGLVHSDNGQNGGRAAWTSSISNQAMTGLSASSNSAGAITVGSDGAHTHNAISDHQHAAAGGHTHSSTGTSHTHTVNSTGSSGTDANIPPYVKLAFIQRIT